MALVFALVMLLGAVTSSATSANFRTFTFHGPNAVPSPCVLVPYRTIDSFDLGLTNDTPVLAGAVPPIDAPLTNPEDIFVDNLNQIYIVDPRSHRIIILDEFTNMKTIIRYFINSNGVPDRLNEPQGVFVTEDGYIYVADTMNARIVVFQAPRLNDAGQYYAPYHRHIPAPRSDIFEHGTPFLPSSLVVDRAGRMFVVSEGAGEGLLVFDQHGEFSNFIGAPALTGGIFGAFTNILNTLFARESTDARIPTPFNNIALDDRGMILAVTGLSIDIYRTEVTPIVRRLNPTGTDVLRRPSGAHAPAQTPHRYFYGTFGWGWRFMQAIPPILPANRRGIVAIAAGPERTFTVADGDRSQLFTYDENGNLLFAFGEQGGQLGNAMRITSIAYQGDNLLVLDSEMRQFTIFTRTQEYGDTLIGALRANNERRFEDAVYYWTEILRLNNNFTAAYVGIANALYQAQEFEEARRMFRFAREMERYSDIFVLWRTDFIESNFIWLALLAIALLVGVSQFFKFVGKVNKNATLMKGNRGFWREVTYAFHVMFRPFDGFWDLKHEKRGSMRAAWFWVALLIGSWTYNMIGRSFLFSSPGWFSTTGPLMTATVAIMLPIGLWATANWCLTTLFDGEGSFKHIFIATAYSTAPFTILMLISAISTHVFSLNEVALVNMLFILGVVWLGFLLFFGMMVTHNYTLPRTLVTSLFSIGGMIVILFLTAMFSGLLMRMVGFVENIILELRFR